MLNAASKITDKRVRGLFAEQARVVAQNLISPLVCQHETMYSETEYFANLGSPPQLSVIDMDVTPDSTDIPEYSWSIKMQAYAAKLEIPIKLFNFDQIRQTTGLIEGLAANAINLQDKLMVSLLSNGQTSTDYNYYGQNGETGYFFSAAHTMGGVTCSNLVTGNTPASYFTSSDTYNATLAQKLWNDFNAAYTSMLAWKNTAGEPYYPYIDNKDLVIVCPPLMVNAFKFAFGAAYVSQTENVMKGTVKNILTSPYFTQSGAAAADWYLFNTAARVRGIMMFDYARREYHQDPPTGGAIPVPNPSTINISTTLDNPNDGYVIDTNRHLIRAQRYLTLRYGEPSSVVCVNNSAT